MPHKFRINTFKHKPYHICKTGLFTQFYFKIEGTLHLISINYLVDYWQEIVIRGLDGVII